MARRRNLMNRPGFPPGRRPGSLPGRRPGTFGGTGNVGRPDKRPKTKAIPRPVSPSAVGTRPGRIDRPKTKAIPRPVSPPAGGRPRPRPSQERPPIKIPRLPRPIPPGRPIKTPPTFDPSKMGIFDSMPNLTPASLRKELALQGRLFSEGGEVNMKTPIDQLPNEGLKKLAKSKKGREAVAKMGFKEGGIAKGGKCPHRGNVRGTGAAVRGVKFVGTR